MSLDAETFWRLFRTKRGALYRALIETYPMMPPHYVMYFVDSFADLEGNPRAMSYVESDLGSAARSLELIDGLVSGGALQVAGARCLDIGCSNGSLLRALQDRGAGACVGVDVSQQRLISARKVCLGRQVDFLQLDAAVDRLQGTFDLIFCLDVLEHVADGQGLIARAAEALAPGGTMYVSLHNARHPGVVLSEPHYGVPGYSFAALRDFQDVALASVVEAVWTST